MRSSIIFSIFAALAATSPVPLINLEKRQTENGLDGACQPVTFIYARGSLEPGNLGTLGPPVAAVLRSNYAVAVAGVNYAASLETNLIGGDPAGIAEAVRLFNLAATKCPDTIIVAGGYSQGAAIMHRSIPQLSSAVINRIAGVVTFGDTYNAQDGGRIRNLPAEKLKIYCNAADGVCYGTLTVTAGHLAYAGDTVDAGNFLVGRIRATV